MSAAPGDRIKAAIITVLGSGHAPFASGTFGSAAALALYALAWLAVSRLGVAPIGFDLAVVTPGIVLAAVLGVRWGAWAIRRYGSDDPKPFVLDEFAGQWIALLFLPPAAASSLTAWVTVVSGQFVLFRAMDVLKPPPARQIDQHWPDGWGITFDDLVAGVYANIAGQCLWRLTPLASVFTS